MSNKYINKKHKKNKFSKNNNDYSELKRTSINTLNKDEIDFVTNTFNKICHPHKFTPAILPAQDRIVVFGDIHGDLSLAIDMLTQSGVATYDGNNNNDIKWIGGTTYVVQVGDQIDRCRPSDGMQCSHPRATYNDEDNDIKIMEMFNNLNIQAKKEGGAVISLLGNHELLNALGRMDYVSYKGIKQFEGYVDPESPNRVFSNGLEARIHAFQPGHAYGKMMGCTRLPAVIIGSNLFVHAGIIDALIEELRMDSATDLEKINIKIKRWLLGLLDQHYVEKIIKYSKNSMFWSRVLGMIPPGTSLTDPLCADNIKNVLKLFNIGSMVIGHTPQSFMYHNDINSVCDSKVWRVDNGSSSAFNGFDSAFIRTGTRNKNRRMQYLEILNDTNFFVCDKHGCKQEIQF